MPATPLRQPTPRERRLSLTFWGLARGTGVLTSSTEPIDIARHTIAVVDALEGSRCEPDIAADALSFLLQLEKTPHYASPEQTRGGEKDRQALVYSIAVLLFERLTGHHPFVESLSPIQAAAVRDRCSVRGANNLCSIPGELRGVLHRAMSPFPEDRWDSVQDLREALIRFVERAEKVDRESASPPILRRPTPATTPAPALRPRRWPRATPPPCPGSQARRMLEGKVAELPLVAARTPAPELTGQPPTSSVRARRQTTPPPIPRTARPRPAGPRDASAVREVTPAPPSTQPSPALVFSASPAEPTVGQAAGVGPAPQPACRALTPDFAGEIDLDLRGNLRRRAVGSVFVVSVAAAVLMMIAHATNRPRLAASAAHGADHPNPSVAAHEASSPTLAPPAPTVIESPVPVAELTPPPFDPDLGGQAALDRARNCFVESRLAHTVAIGFSLRFSSVDGTSNRIYYPSDQPLAATERRCLDQRLIGLTAGAAPEQTVIVTYSLWITAQGGRHSSRVR